MRPKRGLPMSIKVIIGNTTFVCDTPAEAAEIDRLRSRPVASQPVIAGSRVISDVANRQLSEKAREARAFLKKLESYAGQEVSSDVLLKVSGAQSLNGLGPKLAQYRKALLESEHVSLDTYLVKQKPDPNGPTSWAVHKVNGA